MMRSPSSASQSIMRAADPGDDQCIYWTFRARINELVDRITGQLSQK